MFLSGGTFTKSPDRSLYNGTSPFEGLPQLELLGGYASYGRIYKRQPWVRTVVDKLAAAQARLPLKTYVNNGDSRDDGRDTPYGRLLRRPNNHHHPKLFWTWTRSTVEVYGEAFFGKVRDRGGRPIELIPMHPTNVHTDVDSQGRVTWSWDNGLRRVENINRRDLVHFRLYNPDGLTRGLSRLESLRSTLENEEGARRANSALWRNGGRPSVYLKHPKTLSEPAGQRLVAQWNDLHGGVDNWAKAALLEEGMEAQSIALNAEELQYIESRKLNREEVCAVFDIPPPVIHILDHATFSNITEQMRSMYRDTMAPRLGDTESTLDFELRDGTFDQGGEPDFGEGVYAEFLMDEVLRGDFEVRVNAWATAIQTGQATAAEARRAENRPFIEGTDRLLINAALVPVEAETEEQFDRADLDRVNALGQLVRAGFEPGPSAEVVGLPPIPHTGLPPVTIQAEALDAPTLRAVMGRLSRQKSLDDIDPAALTAGLNGHTAAVLAALDEAKGAGLTVAEFREHLLATNHSR